MSNDHFVSRFQLRHFLPAGEGEFWRVKRNKDRTFSKPKRCGVDAAMSADNNDNPSFDGHTINLNFQQLETRCAPVLKTLVDSSSTKCLDDPDSRAALCRFMAMQRLRQPFDHLLQSTKSKMMLNEVLANWRDRMSAVELAAFVQSNSSMSSEDGAKFHSMALLSEVDYFYQEIYSTTFALIAPSEGSEFVISDSPLHTSRIYSELDGSNTGVAYIMPISPGLTLIGFPPSFMRLANHVVANLEEEDFSDLPSAYADCHGLLSALESDKPYSSNDPNSLFHFHRFNLAQVDRSTCQIASRSNPKELLDEISGSPDILIVDYLHDFNPSSLVERILEDTKESIKRGETSLTDTITFNPDGSYTIHSPPTPERLEVRFGLARSRTADHTCLILKIGPTNISVHVHNSEILRTMVASKHFSEVFSLAQASTEIDLEERFLHEAVERYNSRRETMLIVMYIVRGCLQKGYLPIYTPSGNGDTSDS